jgi:uroporphyrinogen III methyltransferase/synthase
MSRARKTTGRIAFVGAGPGDAGMLTVRAQQLLSSTALLVNDPDVPADILALAGQRAEVRPAVGEPGEVAKDLVTEAKGGQTVVRLVSGDPLTADAVVAEVLAVARTSVPFEVVPGVPAATAVPAYAGVPLGSGHTEADVRSGVDWASLAAVPGPLVLHATASHLAQTATALIEHGLTPQTPVSATAAGTEPTQHTVETTLESLSSDAGELTGPLVVTVGSVVGQRTKLSWWESRALYGWKVLVPRTKEQAGVMSERLGVHGAVRAVWDKFGEFGLDARAFAGVKIACVGEATAERVRSMGIVPELLPSGEQSSDGLLADFPPFDDILDPVDRVLLPRADIATETLAAGLRERGWEIDDVTAYRTVRAAPPPAETREMIKTGGFDAVCFTSSSTVRNLVGIAGKPHARTIVACIGPATAETAVEFGLRVDVQPDVAQVDALVDALAEHAAQLRAEGALPPPRKAKSRRR